MMIYVGAALNGELMNGVDIEWTMSQPNYSQLTFCDNRRFEVGSHLITALII